MPRTNFGFRPSTKTQQETSQRFFRLNQATNSGHQQIRMSSWNKHTGRLVLDNFFVVTKDGRKRWTGYKIIIFRDGEVSYDREFTVIRVDGVLELARPVAELAAA